MMASGEIRLSTMTMHRMPVLAQSPDPTQSQTSQSGQPIDMSPSADGLAPVVVTGNAAQSPQFAQVIDPVPVLGIDEYLESPAMQALRQGRLPTPAEEAASQPKYVPRIGVPPPLPQVAPPPPWWLQVLQWLGSAIDRMGGVSPAPPPVCTGPVCSA